MSDQTPQDISPEELSAQAGDELPAREVMSIVSPDPDGALIDLVDSTDPGELPPPPLAE